MSRKASNREVWEYCKKTGALNENVRLTSFVYNMEYVRSLAWVTFSKGKQKDRVYDSTIAICLREFINVFDEDNGEYNYPYVFINSYYDGCLQKNIGKYVYRTFQFKSALTYFDSDKKYFNNYGRIDGYKKYFDFINKDYMSVIYEEYDFPFLLTCGLMINAENGEMELLERVKD